MNCWCNEIKKLMQIHVILCHQNGKTFKNRQLSNCNLENVHLKQNDNVAVDGKSSLFNILK